MTDHSISMRLQGGWNRRGWTVAAAAGLGLGLVALGITTGSRARGTAPDGLRPKTAARQDSEALPAGPLADRWVALAERAVARDPRDPAAFRSLAIAFMRKQRECGDPSYYDRAMAAVHRSLELEPGSYESLKLKAWVLGGLHRFEAARDLARRLVARQPRDPWNYGTLADTQIELGEYAGAVESVQKMIDLKPDLASYSRAARLRELHGDPAGAMQLYDLALDTTSARDPESVAWVRVQRGDVRRGMGNARAADREYQQALEAQPGYHLALAGRARCQAALGKRQAAMRLYELALAAVPRPDWAIALGDLKRKAGDHTGAEAQYAVARAAMKAGSASADTDRLMALFLADHGEPAAALAHARRAARERDDIYTCDALAWALYRTGRYREAWQASERARRLGTRDATLLRHAAFIARRMPGAAREAKRLLRQARSLDPALAELPA